ncbi:MAG: hypothetical protein PHO92_01260 [Candidatus Peribacteraceae bacterium]|nr:hypothetical protein [Candidatus Peribacteraceae bacterium]
MKKLVFASGFTLVLIALSATDAVLTVKEHPFAALFQDRNETVGQQGGQNDPADTTPATGDDTEPSTSGGTPKQEGANVGKILAEQKFEIEPLAESIFLAKIIPPEDGVKVTGAILLENGDRAGVLAWTDSPHVKLYFMALKEALHQSLSPAVKDLVDETQRQEGKPVRNFLSFLDTGISEERIVFVRVRERLYEMHIAPGKDERMFGLLDRVTE